MSEAGLTRWPTATGPTGAAGRRRIGKVVGVGLAVVAAVVLASGCSHGVRAEHGWGCPCKTQVQFFAPPGAQVVLRGCRGERLDKVAEYATDHRLELTPEEFAVFNLAQGWTYQFMYASAEGLPGASIYGEIEVEHANTVESQRYTRLASVPISLPSRFFDPATEHFNPVVGPSAAGLSELELEHLREGDLITKVYFVADLERAWDTIRKIDFHIEKLRSAETVLNTQLEFADARYRTYRREALYADPTADSLAAADDAWGRSEEFIRIEAKRQQIENKRYQVRQQIDDLLQEKRIRTRLLDTMKIVNRRGSLVLATPENQWEYHDTEKQIEDGRHYASYGAGPCGAYRTGDITIPALGEPLVVLRIGGRHKHWPQPAEDDAVALQPK